MRSPITALTILTFVALTVGGDAIADSPLNQADPRPDGAAILRVLGPHAQSAIAPTAKSIGALVAIPKGMTAADLGVSQIAPGIGRYRGSPADVIAFASRHPGVHVEVSPPLHRLMNIAGPTLRADVARVEKNVDGTNTLVGVADTGIDVTHGDLRDASGHTRVAWLLDLSLPPAGKHPDLEAKYGIRDDAGNLVQGAVFSAADIDALIAGGGIGPRDEDGHGTLVSSIAAGNGGTNPVSPYVGVAPKAQIVFARVTRDQTDSISNDDLLDGVQFIFDQADAMKEPIAVNVSLGTDFGPHDGSLVWEQALAAFVGPTSPGHSLVVAAGNSGSISEVPIHQNVYVAKGEDVRVPIASGGASSGGSVQIWVAFRGASQVDVGLDGPDGEWIPFVKDGQENAKNTTAYSAGVVNGSTAQDSQIPATSHGAVVVWSGVWPAGTYAVKLRGEGTVDLFMQGVGDADMNALNPTLFTGGVREGTINLPATNPSLIAVGCTVNRSKWTSVNNGQVELDVPLLDAEGQKVDPLFGTRPLLVGEMAWFSSAGPNLDGVPKPEISAPGALVIGAMSKDAVPPSSSSIFTNPDCPPTSRGGAPDPACFEIDSTHAINIGTSFASPMVAGAIALMFQRDPTLTQDKIASLLQAGAHPLRSATPYDDWGGPGELDVLGSLEAMDQMSNPLVALPASANSWLTLGADEITGDGSTPLTAILELRAADGETRADLFTASRLVPYAILHDADAPTISPVLVRRAPGLWSFAVNVPRGFGGSSITIGAMFDGSDVVPPKTIPIATSVWTANYATSSRGGGCTIAHMHDASNAWIAIGAAMTAIGARRRRQTR